MQASTAPSAPLADADIARLETLLDSMPAPLQPLDVSALDGFLCGVLLQPVTVPASRWLPWVTDMDGQPAPASAALDELQALVRRRHAELDRAIGNRDWFDPWIYQLQDEGKGKGKDETETAAETDEANQDDEDHAASPTDCVLPWVAGFAAAMEAFPALMANDSPELVEPLALLFMHFDPEDLEDADALLAVIEGLEPPEDLADAVQDIVRALMLMADVTRPRPAAPARRPGGTPTHGARRPAGARGAGPKPRR